MLSFHEKLSGVLVALALACVPVILVLPRPTSTYKPPVTQFAVVDDLVEAVELELDMRLEGAMPGDAHNVAEVLVQESRKAGFDPWWIMAIIETESNYRIEACSHSGAIGLMQTIPSTFRSVSKHKRMTDPAENVRAGIAYLSQLYAWGYRWQQGILMSYNGGPGAASAYNRALRNKEDVSGFSSEMLSYPGKVLARYQRILKAQRIKTPVAKAWRTK